MKQYKPLLSSAPAHSILNAQGFRYTNSVSTDIRETFARLRRKASAKNDCQPANAANATNVRALANNRSDALAPVHPLASLRHAG